MENSLPLYFVLTLQPFWLVPMRARDECDAT